MARLAGCCSVDRPSGDGRRAAQGYDAAQAYKLGKRAVPLETGSPRK